MGKPVIRGTPHSARSYSSASSAPVPRKPTSSTWLSPPDPRRASSRPPGLQRSDVADNRLYGSNEVLRTAIPLTFRGKVHPLRRSPEPANPNSIRLDDDQRRGEALGQQALKRSGDCVVNRLGGPLVRQAGHDHSGKLRARTQEAGEPHVTRDQDRALCDRELQDVAVRLSSQPKIPHVLSFETGSTELWCQGAGQVFVDEESGHSADRQDLLLAKQAGRVGKSSQDVFTREVVLLCHLFGGHPSRKLPHDQLHWHPCTPDDRFAEGDLLVEGDPWSQFSHRGILYPPAAAPISRSTSRGRGEALAAGAGAGRRIGVPTSTGGSERNFSAAPP